MAEYKCCVTRVITMLRRWLTHTVSLLRLSLTYLSVGRRPVTPIMNKQRASQTCDVLLSFEMLSIYFLSLSQKAQNDKEKWSRLRYLGAQGLHVPNEQKNTNWKLNQNSGWGISSFVLFRRLYLEWLLFFAQRRSHLPRTKEWLYIQGNTNPTSNMGQKRQSCLEF